MKQGVLNLLTIASLRPIYLSLALIFFSFASRMQYTWSLLSGVYLNSILIVGCLCVIQLYLSDKTKTYNYNKIALVFCIAWSSLRAPTIAQVLGWAMTHAKASCPRVIFFCFAIGRN